MAGLSRPSTSFARQSKTWMPAASNDAVLRTASPGHDEFYFSTRFNSLTSTSSASASITPPHTVSRLRNHDAPGRRIETLQRRMQQKGAAVILGAVAGFRHQDEIRLQVHDRLQRGIAAEGDAEIAGRVEQPGLRQQRTDQAVAAGDPAAPRQRQHGIMFVRHGPARPRNRGVERCDFRRRAIGMSGDFAHLADLGFRFIEVARHGEFGEMKPLLFQQLPRRALVEQAGDDDIRPQHQHILGAAGQNSVAAGIVRRQGLPRVARIAAETEDLFGDRPAAAAIDRCRHSSTTMRGRSAACTGAQQYAAEQRKQLR